MPSPAAAAKRLNSISQAEVASLFTEAGLQLVGPWLKRKVSQIRNALVEPVSPLNHIREYETGLINLTNLRRADARETKAKKEHRQLFDKIIADVIDQPEKIRELTEEVVRIAHMAKAASSFAHDNMIASLRSPRDESFKDYDPETDPIPDPSIPRSGEYYIARMVESGLIEKNAKAIRKAFKKPRFSVVISSHPTRYLTTEFTGNRRDFAKYARKLTSSENIHDLEDLLSGKGETFEALRKFWQAPITETAEDGGPANFTPKGEMLYGLTYLDELFTAKIDNMYRKQDDAQKRILGDGYTAEDRQLFEINLQYRLWMMGDKDGNNNLRSEHFAPLAVLMVRQLAAKRYAEQLLAMEKSGAALGNSPDGGKWSDYFMQRNEEMGRLIKPLVDRITEQGKDIDLPLSRGEFLETLDKIDRLYEGGPETVIAKFQTALNAAYRENTGEAKEHALSLLRKSRIFGLDMAKFHLRETTDEYEPVIANLVQQDPFDPSNENFDYKSLPEKEQLGLLDQLMTKKTSGQLNDFSKNFMKHQFATNDNTDHLRDYGAKPGDKPDVITFHTLQRFEAGAKLNGLITDHVMAQCVGAKHMIETLFLCRVTGLKTTLAPLLEEHKTLTKAAKIFKESFQYRSFRDYAWEMTEGDPAKLIKVLKVVWAHSDNMRVMGQPAARANIYEQVHKAAKEMKKFMPELLALYAEDGRINAEDTPGIIQRMNDDPQAYRFQQFHGGSKCDAVRGGVRSTPAFIDDLGAHYFFEETWQGGDGAEILEGERAERLFTTGIAHSALRILEAESGKPRKWNARREKAMRIAIDKTIKDYHKNHYYDTLGTAMGEAGGYAITKAYKNPGCRGERTASGGIKSCRPSDMAPVDPDDMRTISFTTTNKDMGISASILPMRNMPTYLDRLFSKPIMRRSLERDARRIFGEKIEVIKDGYLTQEGHHTLYQVSATYRAAVIDFPCFGVATSDPGFTVELLKKRQEKGNVPVNEALLDYFDQSIPKDIVAAGLLALKTVQAEIPAGYISPEKLENPDAETCTRMGFLVRKLVLPHMEEQIVFGSRVHDFARLLQEAVIDKGMRNGDKPFDANDAYLLRLAGVLRSVFSHTIYDGAFDRSVAVARIKEAQKLEAA